MNPWAIAIGAALGAVKAENEEKAAHAERKTESTKTRFATFTGQHGKNVGQVDHMGRVMQGATAGAMMGQGGSGQALANSGAQQNNYMGNIPQNAGAQGGGNQMMMQQPQNMYA
jgi:hypothetical protein